jgi:putative protease
MTGVRSEEDKQKTKEMGTREFCIKRTPLTASAEIKNGAPAKLTLKIKDSSRSVSVLGPIPQAAETSPLTNESVCERFSKMGATLFSLKRDDIEILLDENLNISPSALNLMRRNAAEALASQKRELEERTLRFERLRKKTDKLHTALFLNAEAYKKYAERDTFFDVAFLPVEYFGNTDKIKQNAGVYIPPVIFDGELERVRMLLSKAKSLGVKYALITNISNVSLVSEFGFLPIGDFRLNCTNSESARALVELGIENFILHPEISMPMARDIGGGLVVYGRIPLMLTERCFIKENFGCEKCNRAYLTDRKGASFPIMYEFGHRNLILNSAVTYMGDKKDELDSHCLFHRHFIFSTENASEIDSAVSAYKNGTKLPGKVQIRRIGIK